MKQFPASDLSRQAAEFFDAAAVAPVAITKDGKPRFVVMSVAHYAAMMKPVQTRFAYATDALLGPYDKLLDDALAEVLSE